MLCTSSFSLDLISMSVEPTLNVTTWFFRSVFSYVCDTKSKMFQLFVRCNLIKQVPTYGTTIWIIFFFLRSFTNGIFRHTTNGHPQSLHPIIYLLYVPESPRSSQLKKGSTYPKPKYLTNNLRDTYNT